MVRADYFPERALPMDPSDDQDTLATDRLVAQIAAAPVVTLEGTTTRIRELWKSAPTVTSFVRHFGCLFCHQMVEDLVASVPAVLARGARVVIVGNGSLEQARRFFAEKRLPREGVHVVTDPDRGAYKAAGFERGLLKTFNRDSVKAYGHAQKQGFRITGLFGDLTQLGGVLVVKPPASMVYFHKSRHAGDHPRMAEVIRAIP
ncbi:MAG TPA: peroxiredoxin-like family protein [Polyangiaceae bacterium]|nr:peroxiredoxin-like family protein [Polyangiaceae bacterium]